jgi:hypothetical protein
MKAAPLPLDCNRERDAKILRSIKTLKAINSKKANEFLK